MVRFRDFRIGERDWVLNKHLRHYRTAEGFNREFEDAVAGALDLLERQIGDERNKFIIAEADARRIGCVFFSTEEEVSGRIRLFLLTEAYRGKGVGNRSYAAGRSKQHIRRGKLFRGMDLLSTGITSGFVKYTIALFYLFSLLKVD